jgi:trans-aconitate 2-methyltransferase
MTWDPKQYGRFAGERSRPFFDLLARIQREQVGAAADLGCGPGELTRVLAERWPGARFIGVDSSPEMLAAAAAYQLPGRLRFVQADIATWRSDEPLDLIVSNAALHWVHGHERLLPALAAMLTPGGTLAVQMPDNFEAPSHRAIREVAEGPRWGPVLAGVGLQAGVVRSVTWYVEHLRSLGFEVDAWETTYIHVLKGDNPVLEWIKGSALRPLLARLEAAAAAEFLREVGDRLRRAYPPSGDMTLLPFPRLFFVATRKTAGVPAAP